MDITSPLVVVGVKLGPRLIGIRGHCPGMGLKPLEGFVKGLKDEGLSGLEASRLILYYSGSRHSRHSGRLGRHWEGKRHSRLGGLWLGGALFDGVGQTISIFDGRRMVLPTLYYKPETLIVLLSAGVIGYRC